MKKRILSIALVLILILVILPIATAAAGVIPVTIYARDSMVIKADNSLWELGDTNEKILDDCVSATHNAAIKTDGSLWAREYISNGYSFVKIMDGAAFASGNVYGETIVVKTDGTLWGWGGRVNSLFEEKSENSNTPMKITDGVAYVSLLQDTRATQAKVIKTDGSLWEWEYSSDGYSFVKIMDDVMSVSTGFSHNMAIKTDGSLWAWGSNTSGQLGDGTTEDRLTPVKIMDNVASVSAGFSNMVFTYTMATKTDGSLWAWGSNGSGQLGDGTTEDRLSPVKIMDNVSSVSAAFSHTMAIKSDGSLWAWGDNNAGQIGDGTTEKRLTPVKIMDGVSSVSVNSSNNLAVKTDGSLWAWGNNNYGQLGDGTKTNQPSPVKIMDGVKLPGGVAATQTPTPQTVNPTPSTVYVNGDETAFEAYNIGGSNYFKLRDLAYVLNGTQKQFEVGYDDNTRAISLTSGQQYTSVGGEMAQGDGKSKTATPTASKIYLDGKELNLIVYNIGGNNFFKLRDLMEAIDVYVGYDNATRAITLDTTREYIPE